MTAMISTTMTMIFHGLFSDMVERSCSTHGVWSIAKYEACFEQAYYDYIHTLQGHLSTLNRISLIGYSSSLFLLILAFFLLTSLK